MNTDTLQHLLVWAIALILGFPFLIVLLGEVIHRQKLRGRPIAATLRVVRNVLLPVLVFLLFMLYVLKMHPDHQVVKSVQTLLWIVVIHASLSLLNVAIFEQAGADTWRAKMPKLLIDLARLFLILLGSAIVLATVWHADLAGLATALGVSSIVIGLALQDTLGSVTSGIALLFERPFNVGDWLKVGELTGQVIDINWRSVRLQTFDREMVIIPHKVIAGEIIRNFSRPLKLHAERIKIGFSYSDPPNLARQVLKSTAIATQGILVDPEPEIFTLSYDDSSITYEVKFFVEDFAAIEEIRSRFTSRVWYAAQRNNLSIPFPIRTLYHFHGPTAQEGSTHKKFSESLQSLPAFVPIDRENGDSSAPRVRTPNGTEGVTLQHFGIGEKVIRQGYPSNSLYIIVSGHAALSLVDSAGIEHQVLALSAGEFFGEIVLFSGEPSPISITAVNDLEVMMISADEVNQMIARQPSFAREIGQILEVRRRAIASHQESATHQASAAVSPTNTRA
jgi:small-conductance mechanosensitive channel/CRP-like cAMP-binding protein